MISLYDVAFMYVFRNDGSALDNQLVWSFLRKTLSFALSFHELLIILCAGLRPSPSALLVGAILVELTFSQSCS